MEYPKKPESVHPICTAARLADDLRHVAAHGLDPVYIAAADDQYGPTSCWLIDWVMDFPWDEHCHTVAKQLLDEYPEVVAAADAKLGGDEIAQCLRGFNA